MLCLLAVGVLALGVAANAAPSDQPGSVYDSVAPVELERIVATGKGVYGLSADHRGVYEWSSHQDNWKRVFGGTAMIYGGGDSVYATDPSTGSIWKYNGENFDRIGNPGLTFAAADDKVYGIAPDGNSIWEYTGEGEDWNNIGNFPATALYAGPAADLPSSLPPSMRKHIKIPPTLYATNRETGDLWRYDNKPEKWTRVGDPGATFAATDEGLFGLTPNGSAVVERDPKSGEWKTVGERAENIFSSNTLYATNPDTHDLWKYSGTPLKWDRISGPAAAFATSGDDLYRLAPDRRSVQKYNGNGKTDEWLDLHAPAFPATPAEKAAHLNSLIQLGPDATNAFREALDAHRAGKPDPYEFRWTGSGCNKPSPQSYRGYDFTPACARHDFGYRNYKDLFGDANWRNSPNGWHLIDKVLLQDLTAICEAPPNHGPADVQGCKDITKDMYIILTGFNKLFN
jgi:hypothetical protein